MREGGLEIGGVSGEPGTERELLVLLPSGAAVSSASVNGVAAASKPVWLNGAPTRLVSIRARFEGQAFGRGEAAVRFEPSFAGGTAHGSFRIPARVFEQLRLSRASWPVDYTEDDLKAAWLGSHRLLLFVQIAEPDDSLPIRLRIDGRPVELTKAYNSIYGHSPQRTFLGFYADVSGLEADREYAVEVDVPAWLPAAFKASSSKTSSRSGRRRCGGRTGKPGVQRAAGTSLTWKSLGQFLPVTKSRLPLASQAMPFRTSTSG